MSVLPVKFGFYKMFLLAISATLTIRVWVCDIVYLDPDHNDVPYGCQEENIVNKTGHSLYTYKFSTHGFTEWARILFSSNISHNRLLCANLYDKTFLLLVWKLTFYLIFYKLYRSVIFIWEYYHEEQLKCARLLNNTIERFLNRPQQIKWFDIGFVLVRCCMLVTIKRKNVVSDHIIIANIAALFNESFTTYDITMFHFQ